MNKSRVIITIADGDIITPVDWTIRPENGFFWFQRHLREIRDIHTTKNGTQYELYPINYS